MLTITVSFHMYMTKNTWLLFMFELMIASGAKPMIILRNVSLFYSKLVHFRIISGVITVSYTHLTLPTKLEV